MKQRRRSLTDAEVHEAVLRRIREMTREDWLRSIEELSHAPEGVEDPWPPYDSARSVTAASAPPPEDPVAPPDEQEVSVKRRRRTPTLQEAHEAFLRHIKQMTREDWLRSIEELSHAPEGVEDPWPPYDGPGSNGATPASPPDSPIPLDPKK